MTGRGLRALGARLTLLFVGVIAVSCFIAPGAAAISEADYHSYITLELKGMAETLRAYSDTVNNYVGGYQDQPTTMSQLEAQQTQMLSSRNRLRAVETPCSTYSHFHTLVTSASTNFYDGIRTTALFIETGDSSYGDLSVQYIENGNDDISAANAELQSIARPACQAIVSSSDGDSTLTILVSTIAAGVILVGLAAGISARRRKLSRETTKYPSPSPPGIGGPSTRIPPVLVEPEAVVPSKENLHAVSPSEWDLPTTRQEAVTRITLALEAARNALREGQDLTRVRSTLKRARIAIESGDYSAAVAEAESVLRELEK